MQRQTILIRAGRGSAIALVTLTLFSPEPIWANFLVSRDAALLSIGMGNDVPVCYFQTSDQRLINLNRLCQGPPGTVSITSLDLKSNLVLGRVGNQSKQTVRSIRVHYQVVGETGNLIEQASVEAVPSTLQPGQTATFETVLPARSRLNNPYVTWEIGR